MTQARDFWSRRCAGVEAEEEAAGAALAEAEIAERDALPDEVLLAEANLPDPDTLDSPEAVQAFLRAELPQRLKTRALRRLWRLNPIFANLDGLVDYGEDYTDAATVIENMQTVYQVGKGMLTALVEDDPDVPDTDEALELEEDALLAAEGPEIETGPEDPAPVVMADAPVSQPEPTALPQPRMRFAFDTA